MTTASMVAKPNAALGEAEPAYAGGVTAPVSAPGVLGEVVLAAAAGRPPLPVGWTTAVQSGPGHLVVVVVVGYGATVGLVAPGPVGTLPAEPGVAAGFWTGGCVSDCFELKRKWCSS